MNTAIGVGRLTARLWASLSIGQLGLFGLWNEQFTERESPQEKRGHRQNAGWYNLRGEYLGLGDFNAGTAVRVASQLEDGEVFLVIDEQGWRSATHDGEDGMNLDSLLLVERCCYIIFPNSVMLVDDRRPGEMIRTRQGTVFTATREVARSMALAAARLDG